MTKFENWWDKHPLNRDPSPLQIAWRRKEYGAVWLAAMRAAIHMALIDDQAGRSIGVSICNEIEALEKGQQ